MKGLLNKPFSYYDDLSYVFEKDRATGARAEMFADIGSNNPVASDGVRPEDDLDMEFPGMSSPRMNLSPDDMMGGRPSRSSNVRPGSSGSKRKRTMQQIDNLDVLRNAMDCTNAQL